MLDKIQPLVNFVDTLLLSGIFATIITLLFKIRDRSYFKKEIILELKNLQRHYRTTAQKFYEKKEAKKITVLQLKKGKTENIYFTTINRADIYKAKFINELISDILYTEAVVRNTDLHIQNFIDVHFSTNIFEIDLKDDIEVEFSKLIERLENFVKRIGLLLDYIEKGKVEDNYVYVWDRKIYEI